MDRYYTIYKITTPFGFTYIGKSCNIEKRYNGHRYNPHNKVLENEYKLHGFDSIKFELLVIGCKEPWASYFEYKYILESGDINTNKYAPRFSHKEFLLERKDDPFFIGKPWNRTRIVHY